MSKIGDGHISIHIAGPCKECQCETGSGAKPCHIITTVHPDKLGQDSSQRTSYEFYCGRHCPDCSGLFSGLEEALTV